MVRSCVLAVVILLASTSIAMTRKLAPAPVPRTGQTISVAAGDDGDLQEGVVWPVPRFVNRGDGTIRDTLTGLIWLRNAGCIGPVTWPAALSSVSNLADGACGLSDQSVAGDWRLPNLFELFSLLDFNYENPPLSDANGTGQWSEGSMFSNLQLTEYWTSTIHPAAPTEWSFIVRLGKYFTAATFWNRSSDYATAWPVRGTSRTISKTGAATSYAAGDDGDLQRGVKWPNPRFVDRGDGTVGDLLTGLIWLKNASCFGTRTWSEAIAQSNALASGACGLTDGSVAGDWRLPNVFELSSLLDLNYNNPSLSNGSGRGQWTDSDVFSGDWGVGYWTSTNYVSDLAQAYRLRFNAAVIFPGGKEFGLGVWPVRGGR